MTPKHLESPEMTIDKESIFSVTKQKKNVKIVPKILLISELQGQINFFKGGWGNYQFCIKMILRTSPTTFVLKIKAVWSIFNRFVQKVPFFDLQANQNIEKSWSKVGDINSQNEALDELVQLKD